MKKIISLMIVSVMALVCCVTPIEVDAKETGVLYVHNWQDYIGEDTIESFTKETGIRVEYSTFGTNEIMYNDIKSGRKYDLVSPSEYMIEKMANEGLLESYDMNTDGTYTSIGNYNQFGSPYIKDIFESIVSNNEPLTKYAVGYMWGTMGFVYDETVDVKDTSSWDLLWNKDYKNKMTTKDSIREGYFSGMAYLHKDKINALGTQFKSGAITIESYQKELNTIFNDTSDETIAQVEKVLKEQKRNLFGFEVDSGKNDIVTGKIAINFAWSGDAVEALNNADKENVTLYYAVPEEVSNIWFDGWVMPKGANKELAQKFVDFMCRPAIANGNMDVTGYTSVVAGQDVFDRVIELYNEDDGSETIDLSYFFGNTITGNATVKTSSLNRQLVAQYPTLDIVNRCVIMRDFGEDTDKIVDMWGRIKGTDVTVMLIVIGSIVVLAGIGVGVFFLIKKKSGTKRKLIKKA